LAIGFVLEREVKIEEKENKNKNHDLKKKTMVEKQYLKESWARSRRKGGGRLFSSLSKILPRRQQMDDLSFYEINK
jgi:hypothetical protein